MDGVTQKKRHLERGSANGAQLRRQERRRNFARTKSDTQWPEGGAPMNGKTTELTSSLMQGRQTRLMENDRKGEGEKVNGSRNKNKLATLGGGKAQDKSV